jgi:hypothetical protein
MSSMCASLMHRDRCTLSTWTAQTPAVGSCSSTLTLGSSKTLAGQGSP